MLRKCAYYFPGGFDPGRGGPSGPLVFSAVALMRTSIYIDGFNLYYRAVRGTPFKWLDLKQVCERLLDPKHNIVAVNYYTAPVSGKPATVRILKTEEKGSDVNLAVHLLNDAWRDVYDCAVVVSNDSDLAESMRLVRLHHPGKVIGLIFPRQSGPGARHAHPSRELTRHAHFVKHLGKSVLAACQMPNPIPGTTIHKPPIW